MNEGGIMNVGGIMKEGVARGAAPTRGAQEHCYDSFHAWSRPHPCARSAPDRSPTFHHGCAPCRITSHDPLPSRASA